MGRKIYYGLDQDHYQDNDGDYIEQLVADEKKDSDDDSSAGSDEALNTKGS